MLAQFTYKRTFNRVSVTIYVDLENKSADMVVKEDRLIRKTVDLSWAEVSTPEACAKYLGREVSVGDGTLSRLEALDRAQRRGLHPFERNAA